MSYKIKQFRSSQVPNFQTLVSQEPSQEPSFYTEIRGTLNNNNNKFNLVDADALQTSESYYIKFSVTFSTTSSLYLKLKNDSTNTEQTLQAFSGTVVNNEPVEIYFQTVFSPNADGYSTISWQPGQNGVTITIGNVYLRKLFNIVPDPRNKFITKLGVQGPPSLLMCINGEKIRIGKNRIYEMDNKNIKINSLCFCPKEEDFFIADYEYNE